MRLIAEGERGWRELLGELGVVPHDAVYGDLVGERSYEDTVRGTLA